MSEFNLQALPQELIELIIYFSGPNVLPWTLVSHFFRDLVKTSSLLRYQIAKWGAGVQSNDSVAGKYTQAELLELLEGREESWSNVTPDFHKSIPCDWFHGGLYDLADGVLVLSDLSRQKIYFLQLPDYEDDNPEWRTFEVADERKIVDFGLAIHEHDLIVMVLVGPQDNHHPSDFDLEITLSLHQLSTSKLHPEAKQQDIIVGNCRLKPAVYLEIAGDHFVLVISYNEFGRQDDVLVYEWRTGRLVMRLDSTYGTYYSVVWVSLDVFLLPNAHRSYLELWKIPGEGEAEPDQPIQRLNLPALAQDWCIEHISCRSDPNPMHPSSTSHSTQPFSSSPEDAIVLFEFHMSNVMSNESQVVTMLIHRSSLSKLVSQPPAPTHGNYDAEYMEWAPFADVTDVLWEDWGPPVALITRMPRVHRWLTTTGGQRFAIRAPTLGERCLVVWDFNIHNIRKCEAALAKPEVEQPLTRKVVIGSSDSRATTKIASFKNPIESQLPFMMQTGPEYDFSAGVLLDDSRIIGFKNGKITAADILHFG